MCPLRGDPTRGLAPFVGVGEARFSAEPMTDRPFNPGRRLQFLKNGSSAVAERWKRLFSRGLFNYERTNKPQVNEFLQTDVLNVFPYRTLRGAERNRILLTITILHTELFRLGMPT